LRDKEKRNIKNRHPDAKKEDELWWMDFTKNKAWRMEMTILQFLGGYCWRYIK
jgi:hypothetical protein